MKRPSTTDSLPEDNDIASLFTEQNINVPKNLKHSIFEHAERLQNTEAVISNDFTGAGKQSMPRGKQPGIETTGEHTQHNRLYPRSGWLAMAATVLIAVVVAPALLNTPDTSLNSGSVASYELDSTAPITVVEPASLAEPTVFAEAPAKIVAEQTINNDKPIDSLTNLSEMKTMRQQASDSATGGAAGDGASDTISDSLLKFRQTPKLWMEEIQRLIDKDDYTLAQSEYRLFEKQHPDHAKDFKPDFQPQEK